MPDTRRDLLLIEAWRPTVEAVTEQDGKLYFEGVALVDNLLSHNGYFYSAEFNDLCMNNTNAWMEAGNPLTMYTRHSKATGDFLGGSEDIPIGRVDGPLWREGDTIRYKGMIAATSTGRDMQTLIREGIVKPTSIRTYTFTAKPATMDGEDVMWLTDGRVEGIDFCERPGIEGAGVKRIYEEAPPYADPQGEEVPTMELDALTYEELLEHRPDLLNRTPLSVMPANSGARRRPGHRRGTGAQGAGAARHVRIRRRKRSNQERHRHRARRARLRLAPRRRAAAGGGRARGRPGGARQGVPGRRAQRRRGRDWRRQGPQGSARGRGRGRGCCRRGPGGAPRPQRRGH